MTTPQAPSARLAALGLELPEPAKPSFDYVPVTRYGDLLFVSGQLPKEDGEVRIQGRVGAEVDLESARSGRVRRAGDYEITTAGSGQYAPAPRVTAERVFQRICMSRISDQFSA